MRTIRRKLKKVEHGQRILAQVAIESVSILNVTTNENVTVNDYLDITRIITAVTNTKTDATNSGLNSGILKDATTR